MRHVTFNPQEETQTTKSQSAVSGEDATMNPAISVESETEDCTPDEVSECLPGLSQNDWLPDKGANVAVGR